MVCEPTGFTLKIASGIGRFPKEEMSHYAKIQNDFEFRSSSGKWFELSPLNHRGDYDLSGHQKYSGKDFTYTDISGKSYIPNVVEISIGLDRTFYALMDNAYSEDGDRVILKLSPKLAPYKIAVFPLVRNKPEIIKKAREVFLYLKTLSLSVVWDDRGISESGIMLKMKSGRRGVLQLITILWKMIP